MILYVAFPTMYVEYFLNWNYALNITVQSARLGYMTEVQRIRHTESRQAS